MSQVTGQTGSNGTSIKNEGTSFKSYDILREEQVDPSQTGNREISFSNYVGMKILMSEIEARGRLLELQQQQEQ